MTYTAEQIRAAFSARGVHSGLIEAAIEHMDRMKEREWHNMVDDYILHRKKSLVLKSTTNAKSVGMLISD